MIAPLLIGNWKSNTTLAEAKALVEATIVVTQNTGDAVSVGLASPYPWLMTLNEKANGTNIHIGAQNCSATESGAFTGEVTAAMLSECASFVIVGHSERRAMFGDTDEVVRQKVTRVLDQNLEVVLCVGEVLEERQANHAKEVVKRQILAALEGYPQDKLNSLAVAYEPVWAIGTGVAATADDAEEMCAYIRKLLDERFGDSSPVVIQYGGSANEHNAADLLAKPHVGGLLIGGASLKPESFAAMISAAANGS